MTGFAYIVEPPFKYVSAGVVTGCDVELARAVFEIIRHSFEPIETEFSQLLAGLGSRWRMTTGLFDTVDRRSQAAFSRPIWALADGLLVRRGNPRGLSGYLGSPPHRQMMARFGFASSDVDLAAEASHRA